MREIIRKRRMYAGYPVFIITYYDKEKNKYNYSTISSMYTLGDMVVIGLANNNTKKSILEDKNFSVSFLSSKYIDDFEIGAKPGKDVDKFAEATFTLTNKDGLYYIEQAELVYDLSFVENYESENFPQYNNVICRLNKVLAKDSIAKDGILDVDRYNPTLIVGTDQGIFYKTI